MSIFEEIMKYAPLIILGFVFILIVIMFVTLRASVGGGFFGSFFNLLEQFIGGG